MDSISDLAFWGLGSSHAIPEGSVHAKSYAGTLDIGAPIHQTPCIRLFPSGFRIYNKGHKFH